MYQNQKEYWNEVAEGKEFTTPFQFTSFSKLIDRRQRILDVGCGYGRILMELHEKGYENLVGIDFSKKMLERGKRLDPSLNLQLQKAERLEFKENSFDAVILFAVLTCIAEDDKQQALLKEIKRVLKPNGILYINDFLLNDDSRNLARYDEFFRKYQKYGVFELKEGAVLRHHDIEWIKQCISNYETIEFEKLVYNTMNGNKSNGFYYIGKNRK